MWRLFRCKVRSLKMTTETHNDQWSSGRGRPWGMTIPKKFLVEQFRSEPVRESLVVCIVLRLQECASVVDMINTDCRWCQPPSECCPWSGYEPNVIIHHIYLCSHEFRILSGRWRGVSQTRIFDSLPSQINHRIDQWRNAFIIFIITVQIEGEREQLESIELIDRREGMEWLWRW